METPWNEPRVKLVKCYAALWIELDAVLDSMELLSYVATKGVIKVETCCTVLSTHYTLSAIPVTHAHSSLDLQNAGWEGWMKSLADILHVWHSCLLHAYLAIAHWTVRYRYMLASTCDTAHAQMVRPSQEQIGAAWGYCRITHLYVRVWYVFFLFKLSFITPWKGAPVAVYLWLLHTLANSVCGL